MIRPNSTRLRQLRMQHAVVIVDPFECSRYDTLWTYFHCQIMIATALIFFSIPLIRRHPITKWRFNYCHCPSLPVFQCFLEGSQLFIQNHRLLPGVNLRLRAGVGVGQILPTPAPTPTPAKTVDSDRLQLRSRLRLRSPANKHSLWNATLIQITPPYDTTHPTDGASCIK